MSTSAGYPVTAAEADFYGTIDATDADDLMTRMSEEDARDGVRAKPMINEFITLYHPDPQNPSSCYVVPKNPKDRRVALMNLMAKTKVINGKRVQWNNPRPMVEPAELPLRCFVMGCQRAGGFSTRADLIGHVFSKHEREAPMYKAITDRLMEQVVKDIPADQFESLGLDAPEGAFHCKAEGCELVFDTEAKRRMHNARDHRREHGSRDA